MSTEKQIEANKKNAQLSTGPVSEEGKAIVAQNAIKHGIFAQDLIIATGDGKEDPVEYDRLLANITENLSPHGQLEHLLVEKIAVDFWRLRRVLRFEMGSIREHLDRVIYNYYNRKDYLGKKENKSDSDLDKEIQHLQECITWNDSYIEVLKKGIVRFDKAEWSGEGIISDIEKDLYLIAEEVNDEQLSEEDAQRIAAEEMSFEELRALFTQSGYTDEKLAQTLIPQLEKQNKESEEQIAELEQQKLQNKLAEEVMVKTNALPPGDHAEKVMRYENSLQKSILRNLALLKKLQGGD